MKRLRNERFHFFSRQLFNLPKIALAWNCDYPFTTISTSTTDTPPTNPYHNERDSARQPPAALPFDQESSSHTTHRLSFGEKTCHRRSVTTHDSLGGRFTEQPNQHRSSSGRCLFSRPNVSTCSNPKCPTEPSHCHQRLAQ